MMIILLLLLARGNISVGFGLNDVNSFDSDDNQRLFRQRRRDGTVRTTK